jgi:hypothetical protein
MAQIKPMHIGKRKILLYAQRRNIPSVKKMNNSDSKKYAKAVVDYFRDYYANGDNDE